MNRTTTTRRIPWRLPAARHGSCCNELSGVAWLRAARRSALCQVSRTRGVPTRRRAEVTLLTVGLFNATLAGSEKGFYAMAFLPSLFGVVAAQKNVRDLAAHKTETDGLAHEAQ